MSDSKLRTESMDFAVSIVLLVKELKEKRESIVSNQIGRSGTSIGANIREAQYAHSKADFISKLQIALKEFLGYSEEVYRKIYSSTVKSTIERTTRDKAKEILEESSAK